MRVISIKNKFLNKRGGKKIKVLTSGKVYLVKGESLAFPNKNKIDYFILNDNNEVCTYPKEDFQSIQENRDKILKDLGL